MSSSDSSEAEEIREQKQFRRDNPTAWLELTDNQTTPLIIDALLETPPGREFNKTELGKHAGVSRESVRAHIDVLLKFGILEEVPDTNPQRYHLADWSAVVGELFELNSAMNEAATGDIPRIDGKESSDEGPTLDMSLPQEPLSTTGMPNIQIKSE